MDKLTNINAKLENSINVTRPYLPELKEFIPYLEKIWESKVLTNAGPFHNQLEEELKKYLGIEHISLFTNGTLALITALQALRITGEVITTPYSFVATSHSLLWNGIKPVFVDIDPNDLNIDSSKIEALITPQTTAILPVHCYGNPCNIDEIQRIADNYNLKIIYDAAHSFGVCNSNGSILNAGDLSILSFHATKVFNTFEGGAIVCHSKKIKDHIDHLKNFGYVNELSVVAPGINAKMSEFNSALGILQLKHIDKVVNQRRAIDNKYRKYLSKIPGIKCIANYAEKPNYSYFPILIQPEFPLSRDNLHERFQYYGIKTRRYFYPLITEFPMYRSLPSASKSLLPAATAAADSVLCLPIFPDLTSKEQDYIIDIICSASKQ